MASCGEWCTSGVCPRATSVHNQLQEFIENLRHLSTSYIYGAANQCKSYSNKFLHKTLKKLRTTDGIELCKFEKGKRTVILDSKDYFAKLDAIVFSEKFEEVLVSDNPIHHPVLKTENAICYYINRHVKPFVPVSILHSILPQGSQPGAFTYWQKCINLTFPFAL